MKRWYALRCGRDRTCSHSGRSAYEHAFVVERLEHRDRTGAGAQQTEERGALPHVPGRLGHRPQPGQRRAFERHVRFGRRRRRFEHAQRRHRRIVA